MYPDPTLSIANALKWLKPLRKSDILSIVVLTSMPISFIRNFIEPHDPSEAEREIPVSEKRTKYDFYLLV